MPKPPHAAPDHLHARIYALLCQVPPGRVTTYGHLAQQIGCPARVVGFALAARVSSRIRQRRETAGI